MKNQIIFLGRLIGEYHILSGNKNKIKRTTDSILREYLAKYYLKSAELSILFFIPNLHLDK